MNLLSLLLLLPTPSPAYAPSQEMIASPVLLVDYVAWSKRGDAFNAEGSETRAFRELVEILYDRDAERPWGPRYFPEANRLLTQFRTTVCAKQPALKACFRPTSLLTDDDVKTLEQNVLDPASLALLGARWNLAVLTWARPLRGDGFSLVAGPVAGTLRQETGWWDLRADAVAWDVIQQPLLGDAANYVAGFEQHAAPSLFTLQGVNHAALNDWQLRDRSMDFAQRWKHAIAANKGWPPVNPVADDKEILFQKMFDENAAGFARVYDEQLAKVSAFPEVLARFRKERAAGDYPEETYQQLAYEQLRGLAVMQGSYLALAAEQRKGTSPRQQALESLLTLQRYGTSSRAFAMELTTLMTPLVSDAFVIDQTADFTLAQVYVMEQLKALLGIEAYEGKALFPALGAGLLAPVLFQESFLEENAPDLKEALAGRDFAKLDSAEQLRILRLYLVPATGKVRPMGLFRLAAAWLSSAGVDELHAVADRVHEVRKGNFK